MSSTIFKERRKQLIPEEAMPCTEELPVLTGGMSTKQ
jgi:hypothetical protein